MDYRLPVMTQDEMVEAGYMKMMVGAIPTTPEEPAEAAEAAETADSETAEVSGTAGTAEEPAAEQSAPESDSGAAV